MRNFHEYRSHGYCPIIPVEKLWWLLGEDVREKAAKDPSTAPLLDVTKYGYFKVLGTGTLPAQPIVVKAKFFSKRAEEKIKAVGGACLLTA